MIYFINMGGTAGLFDLVPDYSGDRIFLFSKTEREDKTYEIIDKAMAGLYRIQESII